jgi:spore maturation protein CgeB
MKYDYGDKKRGFSYEYESFYNTLVQMGFDVDIFDYLTISGECGVSGMNHALLEKVTKSHYDMTITSLYTNEFSLDFLSKLKKSTSKSIVWMNDDHWRWNSLGKKLCFSFHNVITTDAEALPKYRSIGYNNAILSQFACNPMIFKKLKVRKDIDVSFVGQPNPWRKYIVGYLQYKGYPVKCYGFGWPNGRISTSEMVEIFNRSKICLNLSNSVQYDLNYLKSNKFAWDKNKSITRNVYEILGPQLNTILSPKRKEQIKARIFEITGSGSFALTYDVKHLSDYFNTSNEVSIYSNTLELVSKIQYFLKHDEERERVATSGYKRTSLEHTYRKRFDTIFAKLYPKH